MLTVTVKVDAPPDQAAGVKEALAMYLERFGDTRVVSIVEDTPEQLRVGGCGGAQAPFRQRGI